MHLRYLADGTELTVEDTETGGRASALAVTAAGALGTDGGVPVASGGGYGLLGMRERAELLGGSLDAQPTADGFRVRLWLPSPSSAA